MRILPVMSKYNHNISNPRNSNNFSNLKFKGNADYPKEVYIYVPQDPYSPQRQAIENNYGRKLAQLESMLENGNISQKEYIDIRKKIERERELEIRLLNNKSL